MPVERCWLTFGSMELIGTAGEAEPEAARRPAADRAEHGTSSTVPQVPHSMQRPTHLAVRWRHSEQRYCERAFATP